MDELEKKPETPQEPAARRPEKKNDFDNRRKLMYILCGGYLIYLATRWAGITRSLPPAANGRASGSPRSAARSALPVIGAALLAVVAVRFVREWKKRRSASWSGRRKKLKRRRKPQMNDMTLFLDLILLASGVYCMYTWLRLAVTKHLFKNGLLVPKEKKISDCADEAEYIRYMTPPLAVMAILTLAYGVIMLLNDQLSEPFLPYLWSLVPLVVVLASLVWYAVRNGRANRDYFGM